MLVAMLKMPGRNVASAPTRLRRSEEKGKMMRTGDRSWRTKPIDARWWKPLSAKAPNLIQTRLRRSRQRTVPQTKSAASWLRRALEKRINLPKGGRCEFTTSNV